MYVLTKQSIQNHKNTLGEGGILPHKTCKYQDLENESSSKNKQVVRDNSLNKVIKQKLEGNEREKNVYS